MARNAEKAMAFFEAAAENRAAEGVTSQGRGLAFLILNNDEKAREFLERATAADETLWRAWNGLGVLDDRAEDGESARQHYDRALALAPRKGEILNNIGVSFLNEGRYVEAAASFSRALSGDAAGPAVAEENLRVALAYQGKYQEALAGVGKKEMPAALNNVGYIAMVRGDYGVAEAYFSQALRKSPAYYARAARNLDRLYQLKALKKGVGGEVDITVRPEGPDVPTPASTK
jgi:Flp pilus assembly protein TadD